MSPCLQDEAKELLTQHLLNRDPAKRLTAAAFLAHPWVLSNTHTQPINTIKRLKKFVRAWPPIPQERPQVSVPWVFEQSC